MPTGPTACCPGCERKHSEAWTRSAGRRLSGEVDLAEDLSEGVDLYKREEARASVAAGWAWAGFHTGFVVVAAVVVMMFVEASHKPQEEYKWDPSTRFESQWVCFRASARFLAEAGTRHRQSPHGDNCYLEGLLAFMKARITNKAKITTRAHATAKWPNGIARQRNNHTRLTFRLLLITLFLPLAAR